MNFASIMRSLAIGLACKRPGWKGYCKKGAALPTDKMSDGITPVAYWIIFKQRDGDLFRYRVSDAGLIEYVPGQSGEPASLLKLDPDLLSGMLASDWIRGRPEDFDAAAGGGGTW